MTRVGTGLVQKFNREDVVYFSSRVRERVLKTHAVLIICSEIIGTKIDYIECLWHALLIHIIYVVIFSKSRFQIVLISLTNCVYLFLYD